MNQLQMVTLHVQQPIHLVAVGEGRWIQHNEVELSVLGTLQIAEHVFPDYGVKGLGEAVDLEVFACPITVGVGEINAHRRLGSPRRSVDAEGRGIGKEIEDPSVQAVVPNPGAGIAMVQEEPGVQVVAEIDNEPKTTFAYFGLYASRPELLVLLFALLLLPELVEGPLTGDTQGTGSRFRHQVLPFLALVGLIGVWSFKLGDVEVGPVAVNGQGHLGDVTEVDAVGLQAKFPCPGPSCLDSPLQAVGEKLGCLFS